MKRVIPTRRVQGHTFVMIFKWLYYGNVDSSNCCISIKSEASVTYRAQGGEELEGGRERGRERGREGEREEVLWWAGGCASYMPC